MGKVIKDSKIMRESCCLEENSDLSYTDKLERCFLCLCKEIDIPVPMWLKKNTKEFVSFKRTIFNKEQFFEEVSFDRFEIRAE